MAILVLLALTSVTAWACPGSPTRGGGFPGGRRVPVSLVEYCLEADLQAGSVQHVTVTDRDVRWFSKGSPEVRVERVRLSRVEINRLRRLSMEGDSAFSLKIDRRPRARRPLAGRFLPPLTAILIVLVLMLVSLRRSRPRVRILTRQMERREAWVLVVTTLAVALFVWSTWPDRQNASFERLAQRVRANLVADVTYSGDTVSWRELGSRTLYSATTTPDQTTPDQTKPDQTTPDQDDAFRADLERRIVHARNPDRPFEVQHRVRIHRQAGFGLARLVPWLIAGLFWVLWTRVIRRSCCW